MAEKTFIKVGGTWKDIINIWIKISGIWKSNVYSHVKSTTWHESIVYVPAAPIATAATSVTTDNFIANWEASIGATGYIFWMWDEYDNPLYIAVDLGNVLFEDISNNFILDPDTTYYYYVVAYNDDGWSTDSNTIEVTTDAV